MIHSQKRREPNRNQQIEGELIVVVQSSVFAYFHSVQIIARNGFTLILAPLERHQISTLPELWCWLVYIVLPFREQAAVLQGI